MELSKDSWHYRNFQVWQNNTRTLRNGDLVPLERRRPLAMFDYEGPARRPDLCTYTRIVMLYAPFYRLGNFVHRHEGFFAALGAAIIATFFYLYAVMLTLTFFGENQPWFVQWVIGPVAFLALAAVILSIPTAVRFIRDRRQSWEKEEVKREPKTKVVVEYIKARKSKVCPVLEFKDE